MQDFWGKLVGSGGSADNSNHFATPGRNKLSDIIYGSSQDRSNNVSRAVNPNEFFSFDIPDPGMA